MLKIIF